MWHAVRRITHCSSPIATRWVGTTGNHGISIGDRRLHGWLLHHLWPRSLSSVPHVIAQSQSSWRIHARIHMLRSWHVRYSSRHSRASHVRDLAHRGASHVHSVRHCWTREVVPVISIHAAVWFVQRRGQLCYRGRIRHGVALLAGVHASRGRRPSIGLPYPYLRSRSWRGRDPIWRHAIHQSGCRMHIGRIRGRLNRRLRWRWRRQRKV